MSRECDDKKLTVSMRFLNTLAREVGLSGWPYEADYLRLAPSSCRRTSAGFPFLATFMAGRIEVAGAPLTSTQMTALIALLKEHCRLGSNVEIRSAEVYLETTGAVSVDIRVVYHKPSAQGGEDEKCSRESCQCPEHCDEPRPSGPTTTGVEDTPG
jgi:hypothetical protein